METKRSRPTLVGYPPASVNQVKSIRPAGICTFSRVSKFIQHRWNLDSQLAHASTSDRSAFLFAARAGKYNFVLHVAFHLPDVAGVRFGDVNHQECDPVSELLVELVEGRNLPPEGRSGIASKHQHHWSILRSQRRQLYLGRLIEFRQREIRRRISYLQCARASLHPKRFERKNQKRDRSRDLGHDARKAFRRLPHHAVQRHATQRP